MARHDSQGLFWEDAIRLVRSDKPKKEKRQKRIPKPFWLEPDYLPGLEEALAFNVLVGSDADLVAAQMAGHELVYDIECYRNYFLIAFRDITTKKIYFLEQTAERPFNVMDLRKLYWIMTSFLLISFNGIRYDEPMATLALAGLDCTTLKDCSDRIIVEKAFPHELYRQFKAHRIKGINHVDLKEPAPLMESLKTYGGRMHTRRMQDLPFHPSTLLSIAQIAIVRYYCCNDLRVTEELLDVLREALELRADMSQEYGVDLRSKSDAQIAEAVFKSELEKELGRAVSPQSVAPGTVVHYKVPDFIRFQTPQMQQILQRIAAADFVVNEKGKINLPDWLKATKIQIGDNAYQMGIGGLHSTESTAAHIATELLELIDADVTSYYPSIILGLRLFPAHLTERFLVAYKRIVDRRIKAKEDGLKVIAEALKIVINGSFGKFGNKYSILYAPDFLIQVTITGQLCLLMMIEAMEMEGIAVVSANTDGVVVKCPKDKAATREAIYRWWQKTTGFNLEFTEYASLYSRDVNNYIAIKKDAKSLADIKLKGEYGNPWQEKSKRGQWKGEALKKSPDCNIVSEALVAYVYKGVPVEESIRACQDLTKFCVLRSVSGGAVKGDSQFLGKTLRWYYRAGEKGDLVIATGTQKGNMVPESVGACPVLELPADFPQDVDYDYYVRRAQRSLEDIGAVPRKLTAKTRRSA